MLQCIFVKLCDGRDPPDVYDKIDDEERNPKDVWKLVSGILWAKKIDVIRQQHRLCTNQKPAQDMLLAITNKCELSFST